MALDALREQVARELIRIPDEWLWDFVWLKNSRQFEWTIETNLSLEEHESKQRQLNQAAFSIQTVVGCRRVDTSPCFTEVWIKGEPQSRATLYLTAAECQAEINAVTPGTVPKFASLFFDGTQYRHSFIFTVPTKDLLWESRSMSTADMFQAHWDRLVGKGWRPVLVNIDKQTGKELFRGLWYDDGVPFRYDADLTPDEFQAALSSQPAGWRPGSVDAYNEAGERRYAVVWINDGSPSEWIASTAVSTRDVQAEIDRQRKAGYYPVVIHADPAPVCATAP